MGYLVKYYIWVQSTLCWLGKKKSVENGLAHIFKPAVEPNDENTKHKTNPLSS